MNIIELAYNASRFKEGIASKRAINKVFRDNDESHLYPIFGKFNATERAIKNIIRSGYSDCDGLEYCFMLDAEISRIVNSDI